MDFLLTPILHRAGELRVAYPRKCPPGKGF
jgi:hypothetical protein